MRDKVIALKNEADRVISIGVPVSVLVFFGGYSVDYQVAGGVMVKTTDNIQQGGLSAA